MPKLRAFIIITMLMLSLSLINVFTTYPVLRLLALCVLSYLYYSLGKAVGVFNQVECQKKLNELLERNKQYE